MRTQENQTAIEGHTFSCKATINLGTSYRAEPKFREIRAWHHSKLAFDPMRATNVSNLNKFSFLIVTSFFARAKNAFSGDGYRPYQKGG